MHQNNISITSNSGMVNLYVHVGLSQKSYGRMIFHRFVNKLTLFLKLTN